jgi:anthranilate synthase component I
VLQGDTVIEAHQDVNPLDFVKSYQARFKTPPYAGLPRFTGGLAGYFGYETIRYIEKRLAHSNKPDVVGVPDVLLMVSEEIAVVDNLSGKLYFYCVCQSSAGKRLCKALTRIQALVGNVTQNRGDSRIAADDKNRS